MRYSNIACRHRGAICFLLGPHTAPHASRRTIYLGRRRSCRSAKFNSVFLIELEANRCVGGDAVVDYEKMSSKELYGLLKEKCPDLDIDDVDSFNRETVIACLKISEEDKHRIP